MSLITGVGVGIAIFLSCAQAAPAPNDAVITDMAQAYKQGDKRRLSALLPQAKGHLLEPWAAYWELKARLDEASSDDIRAFLSRYPDTYQEDRLRNDWLQLLGSRRDWTNFEAEYARYRMRDDKEVHCYSLAIELMNRSARHGSVIAQEVLHDWMHMNEAEDGCTFAADRLYDQKWISALDVWHKARLMIENARPLTARNAVEIVEPQAMSPLKDLYKDPVYFLKKGKISPPKARQELIVLALIKIATSDPDMAAQLLQTKWQSALNNEQRHWVWGTIGKQSAMRLDDDALHYFSHAPIDKDLTDDMLAWKVRAALRQSQWSLVESSIEAMSADARKDPAWVYWRARALLNRKKMTPAIQQEATAGLQSIASARGFYEQLATEALGQSITPPARPAPLTPEEIAGAKNNPAFQRALYALELGLRPEGVREWNYAISFVNSLGQSGFLSDRELQAAAQMACDAQVWDRCIATSDRTRFEVNFDQRYPMPFKDAVIARSKSINLDPAYVYGLIRQESRFVMDARSGVGASGLMQVMPKTAQWTAKKIGLTGFTTDQLSNREINIAIGTGYLKLVLDSFEGSMPLAAAAYNAGPSRARRWRAPNDNDNPVLEGAIWAENIPFNETRDYVKKVLANTTNYAALITGQPQSLKARLGMIGPHNSTNSDNPDLP